MKIEKYEEVIGEGAIGKIWLAEDTIGRKVAVKFFHDDNETEDAFNSAKRLGQVKHKNVITFYSFEQQENPITKALENAVIMEYCENAKTLESILVVRISEEQAFNIGIQLIDAIDAIHKKNFGHNDLHDRNILILPSGDLKVIDLAQEQIETESELANIEKSLDLTNLTNRLSEILTKSTSKSIRILHKLEEYKNSTREKSIEDLRKIFVKELICSVDNCLNQAIVEVFLYDAYPNAGGYEFLEGDFTCPYLCRKHWDENEEKAKSPRHKYIKKANNKLKILLQKTSNTTKNRKNKIIKPRTKGRYRVAIFTEPPIKRARGAIKYPYTNQHKAPGYTKYKIIGKPLYY